VAKYSFRLEPLDHQREYYRECRDFDDWALFWAPGLGKSKAAIDNISYLFVTKKIDCVVYIAKKGEYGNFIEDQVPQHLWEGIAWLGEDFKSVRNKEEQWLLDNILKAKKEPTLRILSVNVESIPYQGAEVIKKFMASAEHGVMFITDEATCIKNPKAKRSKKVYALSQMATYRRIMTGTPITRSPTDIWGECQALKPGLLGHNSFYSFKGAYCIEEKQYIVRAGKRISFDVITGYKNLDKLKHRIRGFSSVRTAEECLDLPPKVYRRIRVPMTAEQQKAYSEMAEFAMTQFGDGQIKDVTSVMGLFMSLHQIAIGQLKMGEGLPPKRLESNRFDYMFEKYEDLDDKAIIWCHYRDSLDRLVAEAEQRFGAGCVARYYGGVDDEERQWGLKEFKNPDSQVRFFISNPQSGGYGLTMTIARITEYFANSHNLEHRLQSEDRNMRIGQTGSVLYNDYYCAGTVEERIIDCLRLKKVIGHEVMGTRITDWI